jgi:hypothetical protein
MNRVGRIDVVLDGIFVRRDQKVIVNNQVMGKPLNLTYYPSQGENKYWERILCFISSTIEDREGLKRFIDDFAPELLAKALDQSTRVKVDVLQRSSRMASISELSVGMPGFSYSVNIARISSIEAASPAMPNEVRSSSSVRRYCSRY